MMKHIRLLQTLGGLLVLASLLSCSLVNRLVETALQPTIEAPVSATECPPGAIQDGTCVPTQPAAGATLQAQSTLQPSTPAPVEPTPTEPQPPMASPLPSASLEPLQGAVTTCAEEVCVLPMPFPLVRPIGPGGRVEIDPSYRFGTSNRGKRDVHHGVEFLNSTGTSVVAVADGVVVFAGDDLRRQYGLYRNFYGNFIVIQHQMPGFDEPLYTLYAHLSEMDVEEGELVKAGQQIGKVGRTGAATGSHLHFEVRFGENEYFAARNPELWLAPLPDDQGEPRGILAGIILNPAGKPVPLPNIVLERLTGPGLPAQDTIYLSTYDDHRLIGKDPWGESFASGDLPAGEYQITFIKGGIHTRIVEVVPGQITLVTIRLGQ